MQARTLQFYYPLTIIYVSLLATTGAFVNKIMSLHIPFFGTITTTGATLAFPLTFIISDMISEVYGVKAATKLIITGLVSQLLFACISYFVIFSPYFVSDSNKSYYFGVYGNLITIYFYALMAAAIGETFNIYVVQKYKVLLNGKNYIIRCLFSTGLSKLVYTMVGMPFMFKAIYGNTQAEIMSFETSIISLIYLACFATPAGIFAKYIKKKEGLNIFDSKVAHWNPFSIIDIVSIFKQKESNSNITVSFLKIIIYVLPLPFFILSYNFYSSYFYIYGIKVDISAIFLFISFVLIASTLIKKIGLTYNFKSTLFMTISYFCIYQIILNTPSPSFYKHYGAYETVLSSSWMIALLSVFCLVFLKIISNKTKRIYLIPIIFLIVQLGIRFSTILSMGINVLIAIVIMTLINLVLYHLNLRGFFNESYTR